MPTLSGPELRSNSAAARPQSTRRGDVLDSLVLMIAGLLLPAWLLGHLFLTFYPAPEPSIAAEFDDSNTPAEASTNDSESEPLAMGTESNDAAKKFKDQLESMQQKFKSEVETLKQSNDALAEENAKLKTQVAQATTVNQDATPAENSAAMSELQTKFDSVENEKRTLQTDLANLRAKLKQAETDLAAAVSKNEANMEIGPESDSDKSPFALLAPEEDAPETELTAEANAKVAAAEAKVAELEQQIKELSSNLANSNDAMATQQKELRATRAQMQALQAQNGDLKTALNAARDNAASSSATALETELPKEVFREFVSSKGSVSKMAFIRWDGENVIVRSFANKKLYRLSLDRFSDADRQYLMDQKKQ